MTKQLNLFLSVPATYRIEVLYIRCKDAAFFANERPVTVQSEVLETTPYELTERVRQIAQRVNADPTLPRESPSSCYRVRAFDQEGKLYATA